MSERLTRGLIFMKQTNTFSDLRDNKFFTKSALSLFASYYKPHIKLFVLDLSCALLIAVVGLLFPLATRFALTELLPAGRFTEFGILMILLALSFVIQSLLQYVVTYWGHLLGVRLEADLREELFAHIETLSFSFFDHNRTGHLMSRVTNDLFEISELAHHGPEDLFIAGVTLTGSFIAMLAIRWELALVLLVMIPIIIIVSLRGKASMSDASVQVKERTAEINADLENAISGVRVAKAFVNEEYEVEKFNHGNVKFREAKKGYYRAMASFVSSMEFWTATLNIVVIALGGVFIVKGTMSLADMLTFTLFVNAFLTPIRKLVSFFEQYTNGMAGFRRFVDLMQVRPDIVDAPDAVDLEKVDGRIEFKDVSFSYNDGATVLDQLDLEIRPGHTLALVGPSGGGKTTLCQLIPRFYDVDEGAIYLDGRDIRTIKTQALRRNIGIVQQDVFLFAASVRKNIRYGKRTATDEEIVAAARQAEIHDFIMSLPDGYDTEVGERGARLSGGQKQRISIARIFLKNPPILILDEATSALDTATEVKIQASLDQLATGRTALVIAHRLSTIRGADAIIYIDDEGIKECGTHEQLLEADGPYRKLYDAQFARLSEQI